jgi:hypothetical protein
VSMCVCVKHVCMRALWNADFMQACMYVRMYVTAWLHDDE